jgi:hypothetical protein
MCVLTFGNIVEKYRASHSNIVESADRWPATVAASDIFKGGGPLIICTHNHQHMKMNIYNTLN